MPKRKILPYKPTPTVGSCCSNFPHEAWKDDLYPDAKGDLSMQTQKKKSEYNYKGLL
jgi:hypothetical protein